MAFTGQPGTALSMPGNLELGGPIPLAPPATKPVLLLDINWDDNPTIEFPPTGYTDVSHRVRAFSTQRGSNNFVDRVEAGTGTVVVDNRDGLFNFTQPGRLLMRRARLRAFFDGTYYPLITGHIESYQYGYPDPNADAVCQITIADGLKVLAQQVFPTDYVRDEEVPGDRVASALTEAGVGPSYQNVPAAYISTNLVAPVNVTDFPVEQQVTKPATLTDSSAVVIVDSTEGLSVGMVVQGAGVPAGRKILSIDSGTQFTMDGLAFLTRVKTVRGAPGTSTTTLYDIGDTSDLGVGMAIDPTGTAFDTDGNRLFAPVGTYFVTGVDSSTVTFAPPMGHGTWGLPGSDTRNIPFVAAASQTLTFPHPFLNVTSILDHIRQIETTERGRFLVRADGVYEYQGSGWRLAQTSQLTFGENSGGGEVPYREVPIIYDDTNVANEYQLKNVYTQTTSTISDTTSQANYFTKTSVIEQIWFSSTVSFLPVDQRVFQPIPRLEGVVTQPIANPLVLWPKILGLDISERVSVRRRPLGSSDIFSAYDQFIEAITHDGNPSDWQVKFVTSPTRLAPTTGAAQIPLLLSKS
jgi:hypothetical protein